MKVGISSVDTSYGDSEGRRCSKKVILIIIAALIAIVAVIAIPIAVVNSRSKSAGTKRIILADPQSEEDVLDENLRARIRELRETLGTMADRFKAEIQSRGIEYRDDERACLGSDLTRTCVQGDKVKVIASGEVEFVTRLLVSLTDINTKFEVDVLILFKRYCAYYNVQYRDISMFIKYFSYFRRDVLRMERYNRNLGNKLKMGYYTKLGEDYPYHPVNATEYGTLQSEVASGMFQHTPLAAVDRIDKPGIDWREGGYVTRALGIRNKCRTCWMLAAAVMYDAFVAIKTGRRLTHSAQQLWDCANYSSEHGKDKLENALEYFKTKPMCLSRDMPFMGSKGKCDESKCRGAPIVKNVVKITSDNAEKHLKFNGPFIVSISLPSDLEYGYKGGIYEEEINNFGALINAVVVGLGKDADDRVYWIVQNTWTEDPNWGEDGYFRISDEAANKGKGMFGGAYGLSM